MNMKDNMNSKDKSLNIIKGMAAFSVCSGHILDRLVFYRSNYVAHILPKVYDVCPLLWMLIAAGGIGVIIFCILSGYFSYKSNIGPFKHVIMKCIKRYLDFTTMIFCSNVVIWGINYLNIYDALGDMYLGYQKQWNEISFISCITQALKLISYNGALWMIKYLFYGNVIVYIYRYLNERVRDNGHIKRNELIIHKIGISLPMLMLSYLVNPLTMVTVLGGIIYSILDEKGELRNARLNRLELSKSGLVGGYIELFIFLSILSWFVYRPNSALPYYLYTTPLVCMIIIIEKEIINLFDIRFKIKLDLISDNQIGLFCIHIPVIYTAGSWLYRIFMVIKIEEIRILVVYILTLLLSFIFAYIYNTIVEIRRRMFVGRIFSHYA